MCECKIDAEWRVRADVDQGGERRWRLRAHIANSSRLLTRLCSQEEARCQHIQVCTAAASTVDRSARSGYAGVAQIALAERRGRRCDAVRAAEHHGRLTEDTRIHRFLLRSINTLHWFGYGYGF